MWRIPLSDLNYDSQESEAVQQVLDSKWLTMGPRTEQFETLFAARHGAGYGVAVANCTCALELVYRYLLKNAEADKRVIIVPDMTFVATASAVVAAGGAPLLCDVASGTTPFLSTASIERILESRDDVAGVVLMHYAGHDGGAEEMARICSRHGVALIEDCAHSPGVATADGHSLGTLGIAGCFSFFSNKNLATGEGGMILTNDPSLADWARLARSHGVTSGTWDRHKQSREAAYDVVFPGYNYRCTEITAALGMVQLEKLNESTERRRALTRLYCDLLGDVSGVSAPASLIDTLDESACHIFPALFEEKSIKGMAANALTRAGIQTSHHYTPIHSFTAYSDRASADDRDFACSTDFAEHELTLPLHPLLSDAQVHEIVDTIKSAIQ